MRFFVVWIYLSVCNWRDSIGRCLTKVAQWQRKLICIWLHHGNYRTLLRLTHLTWVGRKEKNRALVAAANHKCLLPNRGDLDFIATSRRRNLLELAATFGQNPQVLAQIQRCVQQLEEVVLPIHQAGLPVVLAPLHMVSDVLAGIVGAAVTPGQATVIVSASAQAYNGAVRQLGGVNLSYCSIHSDSRGIADSLTTSIMEALEQKRNIIIFPDITPDYTVNASQSASAKLPCQLFNRAANLHSGVVRLARTLSARVVCYHLYYDDEIKIHLYPALSARELKEKLPEFIEDAITHYPEDWLLWHAHSLFFINE